MTPYSGRSSRSLTSTIASKSCSDAEHLHFSGRGVYFFCCKAFWIANNYTWRTYQSCKRGQTEYMENQRQNQQSFYKRRSTLVHLVLKSDPKLTYRELLDIMQNTLKSAIENDPLRITGFEHKNQKLIYNGPWSLRSKL